jgi:CRISPR-associated protein Cas1
MLLEISEHGSVLKRSHDCFIVRTASGKVEFPAEKVEAIIITANALVSTQAVALCLEKEIQLVLANWSGKPFGRFWASTPGRATEIRRQQYLNQDSQLAYEISREIVSTKLKEQRRLLIHLKNNRKTNTENLKQSIARLEEVLAQIDMLLFSPQFKQVLLGFEGFAASEYFRAISSILPKKYSFSKRSRNPSQDRFNAVLNYAYGFTYSDIEKVVILSGLDPNAGLYHADVYGKPTLVFDIIEMYRAKVDRLVVRLFTKRIIRDSWFEEKDVGPTASVYLSKEGRRNVMGQYLGQVSQPIQRLTWDYCRGLVQRLLGGSVKS